MKNKFVIGRPMVASSFKQTYNKQLEVYEYSTLDNKVVCTYVLKNGEIVKTFPSKPRQIHSLSDDCYRKGLPIGEHHDYRGTINDVLYFDNVALAMASKAYLLKELKADYIKRIRKLEDTLERNMPKGLDDMLGVLEVEYAEYFV